MNDDMGELKALRLVVLEMQVDLSNRLQVLEDRLPSEKSASKIARLSLDAESACRRLTEEVARLEKRWKIHVFWISLSASLVTASLMGLWWNFR